MMKKRNFAGGHPCPPSYWKAYDECYRRVLKTGDAHSVVRNYMMEVVIIPMFEDVASPELQKKLGYEFIGSIILVR